MLIPAKMLALQGLASFPLTADDLQKYVADFEFKAFPPQQQPW